MLTDGGYSTSDEHVRSDGRHCRGPWNGVCEGCREKEAAFRLVLKNEGIGAEKSLDGALGGPLTGGGAEHDPMNSEKRSCRVRSRVMSRHITFIGARASTRLLSALHSLTSSRLWLLLLHPLWIHILMCLLHLFYRNTPHV